MYLLDARELAMVRAELESALRNLRGLQVASQSGGEVNRQVDAVIVLLEEADSRLNDPLSDKGRHVPYFLRCAVELLEPIDSADVSSPREHASAALELLFMNRL